MFNKNAILVVSATAEETKHIAKKLDSMIPMTIGRKAISHGTISGKAVNLLITGAGIVNTAQALGAVLEYGTPSLIIQTGCAGIFRKTGGSTGDIGIATSETDIHSGIEKEDTCSVLPAPLPFPLLTTEEGSFKNTFPTTTSVAEKARTILEDKYRTSDTGIFKGPFVTVSTITATDSRAEYIYDAINPVMENMEGSAAAHTAMLYKVPFLEIRSASNFVGKRDRSSWNMPLAFKNSCEAVVHLITTMA